ncbi:MAG: histidine phosphatase family protein [Acidimicrobiia bacterium]
MQTLVHLVRHAEVHNPDNTWYGRLEGFQLSERGFRQAEALADYFERRHLTAIYSSPLTRAMQTATAIADRSGLEIVIEPDIIESETRLQGRPGDQRLFRNPANFRYFLNPFRPSWGESYKSISERMLSAVHRIREKHPGEEVAAVSHMTPIVVARMRLLGDQRPAWMGRLSCQRASVSTVVFEDRQVVSSKYEDIGSRVT